ncbi:MAG: hypothetical protein ACYC6C_07575 [Coriobacteriia bacterium]
MHSDSFGFLADPLTLEFGAGRISPVDEHQSRLEGLSELVNPDGFLYPPVQVTVKSPTGGGDRQEIQGSRRPARLWSIWPSHEMELRAPVEENAREGDASFVLHTLEYLFGRRLQFHDWRFDGRVPFTRSTHHVHVPVQTAESFLATAYLTWSEAPTDSRKALTNVLYMSSRAPAYEWDWESYMVEYMVLDAIYANARSTHGLHANRHGDRIQALCELYEMWHDQDASTSIVDHRNGLLHEALWGGGRPGYEPSDDARLSGRHLRCLNQRLIAAALGWKGNYTQSDWTVWRPMHLFE